MPDKLSATPTALDKLLSDLPKQEAPVAPPAGDKLTQLLDSMAKEAQQTAVPGQWSAVPQVQRSTISPFTGQSSSDTPVGPQGPITLRGLARRKRK